MESSGKLFSSHTYSKSVLDGFFYLRSQASLCDVTLHVEERSYHAHRALLAASSDYFRGMGTVYLYYYSGPSQQKSIVMYGVLPKPAGAQGPPSQVS